MSFSEAAPGALVGATLDRGSPDFEKDSAAFLVAVQRAQERTPGADIPVYVVREKGSLLHIQVFPASSAKGGTAGRDGFRSPLSTPVTLTVATLSEPPPSATPELLSELSARLGGNRRF